MMMARKKKEEGNVDGLAPGLDAKTQAFAKELVEHMVQKMAIHGDPDKVVSVNISVYDALAIQSLLKLVGGGFELTPDADARKECLRLAEVLEV
jgi:hypothetical protein